MRITYNGQLSPSSLITYTDIPNILKVEDNGGGTNAVLTLTLSGNLAGATTYDGQWYINILGDTITNVRDASNAISKNFFVSTDNASTAASICRALRNCSTIAASFKVLNNGNKITLTARAIGPVFAGRSNWYDTNISTDYLNKTQTDGAASSPLFGSKINVDIYSDNSYITTLEKNYYGSEAAFNLSPVLSTISENGKSIPYNLKLSKLDRNGSYASIGELSTNYSVVGYMVNQGYKYQFIGTTSLIAQNMLRGQNRDVYNNSLLYVYEPSIPISFYMRGGSTLDIEVKYLDSAFNQINRFIYTYTNTDAFNILKDVEIPLTGTNFSHAFYVDLKFSDTGNVVRYNVIKPLKMTEYCQRIYFRNSYGGISFVDVTGSKSIQNNSDIQTYSKNIFDYYTDEMNSLEKTYDIEVKTEYTLKSHLMEADGRWIYYDLMQSPEVWTVINGEKYQIIIESCSVDETNANNDIYEATVRFRFSQPTTLL